MDNELSKKHNELRGQLLEMSATIDQMEELRAKFLNDNARFFADFQVGEIVVNVRTFEEGIVTGHRVPGHAISFDVLTNIECPIGSKLYHTADSYHGHPFVALEDFKAKNQRYVAKLESMARTFR